MAFVADWLAGWLAWLAGWLAVRLAGWLAGWLHACLPTDLCRPSWANSPSVLGMLACRHASRPGRLPDLASCWLEGWRADQLADWEPKYFLLVWVAGQRNI